MEVAIIGAGIAGLSTAVALERLGISYKIYESAPSVGAVGAGIMLASNAMKAYRELDISEAVIAKGRMLGAYFILDEKGKTIAQTDSKKISQRFENDNFVIHRADLHDVLFSSITQENITLGKRLISFSEENSKITMHFGDGSTAQTDYLIAADGIHSPVRKQLLPHSLPRYAGYSCWRAVMNASFFESDVATETWGKKGRFGISPMNGHSIYWYACINGPKQSEKFRNYGTEDLAKNFSDYHHPVKKLIENTPENALIWNDIIDIKPINKYAFGNVLLIGDAAHATTPNMGQGACQGIEDSVFLMKCIARNPENFAAAFKEFEKIRLSRTHGIINRSRAIGAMAQSDNGLLIGVRNFMMRNLPPKLASKQIEKVLDVHF